MFRKSALSAIIFSILITIFILSSCATEPNIAEPADVEPVALEPVKIEQAMEPIADAEKPDTVPVSEEQAAPSEPETPPDSGLEWALAENSDLRMDEAPLPEVSFREITMAEQGPAEEESRPLDELEAGTAAPPVVEPEPAADLENITRDTAAEVAESEGKSFLELFFDPESTMAKEQDVYVDTGRLQSEPSSEPEPELEIRIESGVSDAGADKKEAKVVIQPDPAESIPEEPVTLEVETSAPPRELFVYNCEGEGWRLAEINDGAGNPTESLRYTGREYLSGNTVFSFYPYSGGVYLIRLVKTDFATGISEYIRLKLNVVDEASSSAELVRPVTPEDADSMVVFEGAENTEKYEAESSEMPFDAEKLLEAAGKLEDAGDCSGAASLLEDEVEDIEWNDRDAVYFELARLYEKCTGTRDERRAVEVYRKIVDYYPVSNYWMKAKERITYLERNFIYIR